MSRLITNAVYVPLRLISTQDEGVFESIIRATNRQTEVKGHQFFAMKVFAKQLEDYFKVFPVANRLYYERRSNQYNAEGIEKKRIIAHQDLVRAFGAMFLGEPHITTKNFRALKEKVGDEMFREGDRMEPYYVSALALYRLERLFPNKLDPKYKPARYQILLTLRLLMDGEPLPQMNSYAMERRCDKMIRLLSDEVLIEKLIAEAASIVDEVAGPNWDRDSIRTEPITKKIFERFGQGYERKRKDEAVSAN